MSVLNIDHITSRSPERDQDPNPSTPPPSQSGQAHACVYSDDIYSRVEKNDPCRGAKRSRSNRSNSPKRCSGTPPVDRPRQGIIDPVTTESHKQAVSLQKTVFWRSNPMLLQPLEDTNDFYCERLGLVKLESWSYGRVVLLGDAVYCPSATTGMGTTSSLVGAYILAGEISKHCGCPADEGHGTKDGLSIGLKAYDQKFRPFMDQVQKGLAKGSNVWDWIPSTLLGIAVLNFLLGVVAFLRLNIFGKWILREDVGEWTLPDYKEMVQGQK